MSYDLIFFPHHPTPLPCTSLSVLIAYLSLHHFKCHAQALLNQGKTSLASSGPGTVFSLNSFLYDCLGFLTTR